MELEPEDVSLLEKCPHFRGCYVQASMELGPEDVSLLERCPHFRGCYVQASMELGPEDVSLLEKYITSFSEGVMYRLQWSWNLKCVPIREVSSFKRVLYTDFNGVGTRRCIPIREVYILIFRGCYVQASMELEPEDVSLLEKCPHFRGCYIQASIWSWDCVPNRVRNKYNYLFLGLNNLLSLGRQQGYFLQLLI